LSQNISALPFEHSTLVDLLAWRAAHYPAKRIYSFLNDGEVEKDALTFATLDYHARAIAAHLQEYSKSGERVLLIFPSGLEFIAAFFGCLYSGTIAVPVYPPSTVKADRNLARFRAIANDAQVSIILTTSALASRVEGLLALAPELQQKRVLVTDTLLTESAALWRRPAITGETLAFLQYTSGSTGTPKGVMVNHSNLLHNSALIGRVCKQPEEAHLVTWLPLYHDLGLIGGVLQPLYAGFESTILAPTAFLQRPIRWLQAISRLRGSLTGAPNFAYDLCVRKITPEQKEMLDLSSWVAAANGAEPVRAETLEQFTAAFASCGFRREAFLPCYGLAEATLFVCGGLYGAPDKTFDGPALANNEAIEAPTGSEGTRTLVSLGPILEGQEVVIADAEALTQFAPDRVGEIWVSGPSIAQGYWQHPEESESTFRAYLASGEGPFLRTGDLGFIHNGELYITGRLKDLIIIRGSNHYPQDIERTVEQSHPALRTGGIAAFSVEAGGEERLIVVSEIERQYLRKVPSSLRNEATPLRSASSDREEDALDEIVGSMRQAIAEQHELQLYAAVLIKPASMLKTSSGKVQRRASKEGFLNKSLDAVYEWTLSVEETPLPLVATEERNVEQDATTGAQSQERATWTKDTIQSWLVTQIAERLRVNPHDIDMHAPLAYYGMDSVQAVGLSADLETLLGREVPPTLAYDYPTIDALARYLAGEASDTESSAREDNRRETASESIAIIGIGCRFPDAPDPESFWQSLHDGKEAVTEVPPERWDLQALYDPNRATPGKMHTRWGSFLQDVDLFDPTFFSISPREAMHMDPQQRILLEVAWEALEHAGLAPTRVAGSKTGVFVGISSNDYAQLSQHDPALIDAYVGTGNAHSIAANRLSYFLDLHGPSIAVDTACSSSLVAVHMACQSIRAGECDMALAGGVNVILSPELSIAFSQAQMMSATGHCKTFDEDADGYVRGEGCGIVVLKPLSQALRDGDAILALIRGSAINQDGRSNGLTAPNGPSQEVVIRQALHNADVTPNQVSYVETHGSSTPLGDPIEFDALKAILMQERAPEQLCVLGSVKTNIGHLEAAAGIAGLIKVVLSLHKEEIPAHLNLRHLNHHISLAGTSFQISRERRPWPISERRIAGVSAFGFGGTNVHIIVEAAPTRIVPVNEFERPAHMLMLSAQSKTALKDLTGRYATFLADHATTTLADLCFSANSGRAHFAHRVAFSASSGTQLRERLKAFAQGRQAQGVQNGKASRREGAQIAFLFTGQGSQYPGMGRQLYDTQPVFRRALDRCDELLRPYLDRSLLAVIYPDPGTPSLLSETAYTQPALFALEYALTELWHSWGIEPGVVMGHSVGEYVAACVAGAFSLEDGLKLIAARGRLMQELPQSGTMLAVFTEPAQLEPMLAPFAGTVMIATFNGPGNTVISGERAAVQAVQRQLEAEGVTTHPLAVSHAFHSPLMDPMLAAFEQIAGEIHTEPLRIPLVSNLSGEIMQAGETLDAYYWRKQTREAVQFAAGMRSLAGAGYDLFLELGPTPTLLSQGRRCLPEHTGTWLASLQRERDDWDILLQSVGVLYTEGVELDWRGFDGAYVRRHVSLPTYPFQRDRYWIESTQEERVSTPQYVDEQPHSKKDGHPFLDKHMELTYPTGIHVWETELDKQQLPYLSDHRIQGAIALPISAYIEMIQAAALEAFGQGLRVLKEIELKKILFLPEQGAQKVQIALSTDAQKHISFHISSHPPGAPEQPRDQWALHATGEIVSV